AQVMGEITALCDRLRAEDPALEIAARATVVRQPFEAPDEGALVPALAAAARDVLGREPERIGVAFWMDAALYGAAGVETAVIGPSGAGAHAAEEWVDLASCHQVAAILARAATAYCTSPRS
ncbi:MAG: M20/M25/M40 family metallo-hydrolase, partial [Gemmatimonadota bacterium]